MPLSHSQKPAKPRTASVGLYCYFEALLSTISTEKSGEETKMGGGDSFVFSLVLEKWSKKLFVLKQELLTFQ